jgi:hypothetical protein
MESELHRQLKELYAGKDCATEVRMGSYRIDAVRDGRLIEIQHGSLSAISRKVRRLLEDHRLLVVKPLVVKKRLLKRNRKGGKIVESRWSPKRRTILDIFEELVYFTRTFPHPRLTLDVPLIEIDEIRYPGHGRRRRRRESDFVVECQTLTEICSVYRLRHAGDLRKLLSCPHIPEPFDTGDLARELSIRRWEAQKIAYCLRHMQSTKIVGKRGNAWLYRFARPITRRELIIPLQRIDQAG